MSEPFLAPKGSRDEFFLKLDKRLQFPQYTLHLMVDREGRKAMFYNIKGGDFEEGDCILMKATVARHDVRDGKAQTYLNRCVFIKNYGSKEEKPTWQEQLAKEPTWA